MKRFHVHVSVPDLTASIGFYSKLFGADPAVRKTDYAKWMLDDPRVNFAISTWNPNRGVNHLGLQADSDDELNEIGARFAAADAKSATTEPDARCCYSISNKHWVQDPQGIAWEAFHTLSSIPTFSPDADTAADHGACCDNASAAAPATACCDGAAATEPGRAAASAARCCG